MTYETQFTKIERKWQEKWEAEKAFEPQISRNKKKLLLTVPYPYTSGPLHIGHGRTYTIADVYARFKRMQGFNVLWPMSFHITGTPILAVSKRIQQKEAAALQTYTDYISQYEKSKPKIKQILDSFVEPQNVADYFADVIIQDFKSLGFSIDWSRRFTTGDKEYNKFIEWQFYRLKELGLITKGDHTVLYCTSDKNAVGEDDIQNGDTIEPGIQEYVLLKFKLEDSFIIAATLRPETVYGQTNLWVKPDVDYVRFEIRGEKWIGSREFFEKLQHQGKNPKEISKVSGKSLIGKSALAPGINREIIILPADFPNPDIGSGIVTSVPGHSMWDYIALRELKDDKKALKTFGLDLFAVQKVEPISIIKLQGASDLPAKDFVQKLEIKSQKDSVKLNSGTADLYKQEFHVGTMKENCGDVSGMKVAEAKELVKKNLVAAKKAEIFQDVSALELPVKCRCGGKVVVSLLKDQWYINYGDEGWKENTRACFEKMKIIPEMYRPMFDSTINWLHERACARMRGLGTKLPWDQKWIIESLSDSTIYTAFYTVINLIRHHKLKPEQLTQEFWNYVFLGVGTIPEVFKHTGIKSDILKEIHDSFEYWYPCDLRHTAVGHITNHLTFYIFNHVALFSDKFWPVGISLNEFLICEGAKMSKSKGNVIPLADIPRKYGADLYRLYIAGSANLDAVVDWREKNVVSAQKRMNKLYEIADEIIKQNRKPQTANR
ncbi:TPA: leucine--tRNA ligase, partial [archaeon]|nr:leucine--tRNA ligase [Candidatus Naiadarchaeales archaeon SRR2090153.bin461]